MAHGDLQRPLMADGLEIVESEDGLIIYDQTTDQVHHLNQTASVILVLCDGANDVEAIARQVAELFSIAEPPTGETDACLRTLADKRLVRLDGAA